MTKLPDERTMQELLFMGKDLENRGRKIYQMSEAFAQKYEQQSTNRKNDRSVKQPEDIK